MADAVQVVTSVSFTPSGGMAQGQAWSQTKALANPGSLQALVYQVAAGTPQVVALPTDSAANRMVLFTIDDAVNPQAVTFAGSFYDVLFSTIYTQSQRVTTQCPYLGPWMVNGTNGNTTITNNGTGTTTVRVFIWGV